MLKQKFYENRAKTETALALSPVELIQDETVLICYETGH